VGFGISACLAILFAVLAVIFIWTGVKTKLHGFYIGAALAIVASLALLGYGLLTLLI
jgi:hypothetical protein